MSKSVKHTVPGAVGVRRSPRIYTHAIIGRKDWDAARKAAHAHAAAGMAQHFRYMTEEANLVVGALRRPDLPKGALLADWKVEQKDVDRAREWLAKNPTLAIAITNAIAREDGFIAKAIKAIGGRDVVEVLAWSQSAGNAAKAAKKYTSSQWYHYVDVRVVETVRHDVIKVRGTGAAFLKGSQS